MDVVCFALTFNLNMFFGGCGNDHVPIVSPWIYPTHLVFTSTHLFTAGWISPDPNKQWLSATSCFTMSFQGESGSNGSRKVQEVFPTLKPGRDRRPVGVTLTLPGVIDGNQPIGFPFSAALVVCSTSSRWWYGPWFDNGSIYLRFTRSIFNQLGTHVLHGAGIFTTISHQNDPVL